MMDKPCSSSIQAILEAVDSRIAKFERELAEAPGNGSLRIKLLFTLSELQAFRQQVMKIAGDADGSDSSGQ